MKIVCVQGTSGSGKSYLNYRFNKLTKFVSYDSDDVSSECFFEEYDGSKETKTFWNKFSKRYEKKWKDYMIRLKRKIKKFLLFVGHNHYHLLLQNKMYYGVGLKLLIIQ